MVRNYLQGLWQRGSGPYYEIYKKGRWTFICKGCVDEIPLVKIRNSFCNLLGVLMNMNGWHVRGNIFIKGFMDYVVEVKEAQPKHIGEDVRVTIWKGDGYENTKHYEYFPNFEQAFKFVDEFSKQKFFDQAVEEYFK